MYHYVLSMPTAGCTYKYMYKFGYKGPCHTAYNIGRYAVIFIVT